MKLFLNSFHIDHYQVMFVSPLYDSPGSWNKTPPCPSHCLSQSFQELHTLFCAIPLDASPFAKLPHISSLALHFPVFWEHSHFQQQECAVKKQFSSPCVFTDLPPTSHAGDTFVWWFTLIFHCLQQKQHILSKSLYFQHLWPKGDFQRTGRDLWIH